MGQRVCSVLSGHNRIIGRRPIDGSPKIDPSKIRILRPRAKKCPHPRICRPRFNFLWPLCWWCPPEFSIFLLLKVRRPHPIFSFQISGAFGPTSFPLRGRAKEYVVWPTNFAYLCGQMMFFFLRGKCQTLNPLVGGGAKCQLAAVQFPPIDSAYLAGQTMHTKHFIPTAFFWTKRAPSNPRRMNPKNKQCKCNNSKGEGQNDG